jgi:hypothetical protein
MSSELELLANTSQNVVLAPAPPISREAGNVVAGPRGPVPVWRSLLSPWPGQRALVLGKLDPELFRLLKDCSVRVERQLPALPTESGVFDLILEERQGWRSGLRGESVSSLLATGGRWITVVHGRPFVGIRGSWMLARLRRQGFGPIETFYAHANLWSPQFLVPLERLEPFEFFLRLAVGGRATRRRAILSVYQLFGRLGIHRGFLPNCIMVARRLH